MCLISRDAHDIPLDGNKRTEEIFPKDFRGASLCNKVFQRRPAGEMPVPLCGIANAVLGTLVDKNPVAHRKPVQRAYEPLRQGADRIAFLSVGEPCKQLSSRTALLAEPWEHKPGHKLKRLGRGYGTYEWALVGMV